MKHLRTICLVALGWPLLACDPPEPSDEGQYWLELSLTHRLGERSRHVLLGSSFTVDVVGVIPEGELDEDQGGLLCATSSTRGGLTKVDSNRYVVAATGPGAIQFAAPSISCPENDDILAELGPDSWAMVGVDPSAAVGKWIPPNDSAALVRGTTAGPAVVFPDALGRPIDELRVVAEHPFEAAPVLVDTSISERTEIRWDDPEARLTVPGRYQALTTFVGYDGELEHRDSLRGTMHEGESFESSITIVGQEFELPEVRAVPATEIQTVELVPLYWSGDAQREWGPPVGIIAIARDGDGRRVLGAPLEWSITRGRLGAHTEYHADALEVADCRDEPKQPQWRGATIEAELDDLVASVELEWIALPTDVIDPTSELCQGSACDCSTAASPRDSVFATLALLGLGGLLRRRHAATRRARSTSH